MVHFNFEGSPISSFYYDRIEDLLPEKRLVTQKLFKNQPINKDKANISNNSDNISMMESPPLKDRNFDFEDIRYTNNEQGNM